MKYLSIIFFTLLTLAVSGQRQLLVKGTTDPDTLTVSSATGTVYLYPGATTAAGATEFSYPGSLLVAIESDSLSGATGAYAILQYCADASCTYYKNIDTLTLNGSANQYQGFSDDNFEGLKWRVAITTISSSTQSTSGHSVLCV